MPRFDPFAADPFTPKAIGSLEPLVRKHTHELLCATMPRLGPSRNESLGG